MIIECPECGDEFEVMKGLTSLSVKCMNCGHTFKSEVRTASGSPNRKNPARLSFGFFLMSRAWPFAGGGYAATIGCFGYVNLVDEPSKSIGFLILCSFISAAFGGCVYVSGKVVCLRAYGDDVMSEIESRSLRLSLACLLGAFLLKIPGMLIGYVPLKMVGSSAQVLSFVFLLRYLRLVSGVHGLTEAVQWVDRIDRYFVRLCWGMLLLAVASYFEFPDPIEFVVSCIFIAVGLAFWLYFLVGHARVLYSISRVV